MTHRPLFVPIDTPASTITLLVDGEPFGVPSGISVAAALIAYSDHRPLRQAAFSGSPRAPYCLMGACFECAVRIDDQPGRRACLTEVRDGMHIDLGARHDDL